jgi:hypothetical protein
VSIRSLFTSPIQRRRSGCSGTSPARIIEKKPLPALPTPSSLFQAPPPPAFSPFLSSIIFLSRATSRSPPHYNPLLYRRHRLSSSSLNSGTCAQVVHGKEHTMAAIGRFAFSAGWVIEWLALNLLKIVHNLEHSVPYPFRGHVPKEGRHKIGIAYTALDSSAF